ncbi:MAG: T9SS type A sorting domain-containing protein, partial [Saprospiraceae bacterium]|nr:T9SS type A sorting domain-containing protein [Saprospiraceae bacterium]
GSRLKMSMPMAEGQYIDPQKPLFYLNIMVQEPIKVSEMMALSDLDFSSELYTIEGQRQLALSFSSPMAVQSKSVLMQNYPNPFRHETTIEFWLQEAQDVGLKIYDPAGRVVYQMRQYFDAGNQQVKFNESQLTPGVLYYELQTKEGRETKRMILLE